MEIKYVICLYIILTVSCLGTCSIGDKLDKNIGNNELLNETRGIKLKEKQISSSQLPQQFFGPDTTTDLNLDCVGVIPNNLNDTQLSKFNCNKGKKLVRVKRARRRRKRKGRRRRKGKGKKRRRGKGKKKRKRRKKGKKRGKKRGKKKGKKKRKRKGGRSKKQKVKSEKKQQAKKKKQNEEKEKQRLEKIAEAKKKMKAKVPVKARVPVKAKVPVKARVPVKAKVPVKAQPPQKLEKILKKIQEKKQKNEIEKKNGSPKLKKVFPIKVKIETVVPVDKQKLIELKKLKKIKKQTAKMLKTVDPCQLKPCRHDGICEKSESKTQKYKCVCPKGRRGKHCEYSVSNVNVALAKVSSKKATKVKSGGGGVIGIILGVCIPVALIAILVIIHCIRVQNKRSELIAKYEQDVQIGVAPTTPLPDIMSISNGLCDEMCCGWRKPPVTVNDVVAQLERVATREQLNELINQASTSRLNQYPVNRVATGEQLNELVNRVASARLSQHQVNQLNSLVSGVSRSNLPQQ